MLQLKKARGREVFNLNPYELMLIFNPNLGEEKIGQMITKIEDKIKSLGGEIKKTDKWGTRKLASLFKKTNKLQQGYYVIIFFNSTTPLPATLQAYLKVTEEIIRFSLYKSVEKKEAPLVEIEGVPLEGKGKEIVGTPKEGEKIG